MIPTSRFLIRAVTSAATIAGWTVRIGMLVRRTIAQLLTRG